MLLSAGSEALAAGGAAGAGTCGAVAEVGALAKPGPRSVGWVPALEPVERI